MSVNNEQCDLVNARSKQFDDVQIETRQNPQTLESTR